MFYNQYTRSMTDIVKKKFKDINLNDQFFDSLKNDYPDFATIWFPKCVAEDRDVFVYEDEQGIGLFAALKQEDEEIDIVNQILPKKPRIKISTFKIADRLKGQRLGEGAIAYVLWTWQQSEYSEIYLTSYDSHRDLIDLFEKFGFEKVGQNKNGEWVLIKNNYNINISNPYKSFPYISETNRIISYLPIEEEFHDTLFPYSDLANTEQNRLSIASANGITKMYISKDFNLNFHKNDILLIYRKSLLTPKSFHSCITSYCVVDEVKTFINNGNRIKSLDEYLDYVGNKSYYDKDTLVNQYKTYRNLVVIKMLYYGYFGAGNNITYNTLKNEGLWPDAYPTTVRLTIDQFIYILKQANLDPSKIIR